MFSVLIMTRGQDKRVDVIFSKTPPLRRYIEDLLAQFSDGYKRATGNDMLQYLAYDRIRRRGSDCVIAFVMSIKHQYLKTHNKDHEHSLVVTDISATSLLTSAENEI